MAQSRLTPTAHKLISVMFFLYLNLMPFINDLKQNKKINTQRIDMMRERQNVNYYRQNNFIPQR